MQVPGSAEAEGLSLGHYGLPLQTQVVYFKINDMVFISDKIMSRETSRAESNIKDKDEPTSFGSADKKGTLRKEGLVSMGTERRSDSLHPGLQGQKQLALLGGHQGYGAHGSLLRSVCPHSDQGHP